MIRPNYAFRNGYFITYIIDIIIRSFFKHCASIDLKFENK